MAPKVENKQGRLNLSEFIVSMKLQMCRWFEHEFVNMNIYENRQITAPMPSQSIPFRIGGSNMSRPRNGFSLISSRLFSVILTVLAKSSIVSRFLVQGLSPVKLTASELNRQDQAQRKGWRCCQGSLEGCRRAQVSQDPHFHHLPPSQDPSALSVAQVPPQVDPS
jgi:hypothetical protein